MVKFGNAKLVAEKLYLNWPRLCDKELRDTAGGKQSVLYALLPSFIVLVGHSVERNGRSD